MHIYIYANIHTICLWLVPQHKFTIRLIICLPRHAQDCRYKSYKYFCWRVGTHIHAYAKTPTHPPTPHSSNPLFHSHAPSLSERNPSAKNRVQNSHPMRPADWPLVLSVRLIRVRLVLVNLNPINDTYIPALGTWGKTLVSDTLQAILNKWCHVHRIGHFPCKYYMLWPRCWVEWLCWYERDECQFKQCILQT